jgi:hypothetical protein
VPSRQGNDTALNGPESAPTALSEYRSLGERSGTGVWPALRPPPLKHPPVPRGRLQDLRPGPPLAARDQALPPDARFVLQAFVNRGPHLPGCR